MDSGKPELGYLHFHTFSGEQRRWLAGKLEDKCGVRKSGEKSPTTPLTFHFTSLKFSITQQSSFVLWKLQSSNFNLIPSWCFNVGAVWEDYKRSPRCAAAVKKWLEIMTYCAAQPLFRFCMNIIFCISLWTSTFCICMAINFFFQLHEHTFFGLCIDIIFCINALTVNGHEISRPISC